MDDRLIERVRSLEACRNALRRELTIVEAELERCNVQLGEIREKEEAVKKTYEENAFLQDKKTRRLAEYFKTKGLLIRSIQEVSEETKKRYKLAKTILGATAALKPVMKFLYDRKSDTYDVSTLTPQEKVSARNFLIQLKSLGWLETVSLSASGMVTVKRAIPSSQYMFFNGGWAEEATRYQIERTLHDLKVPYRATYREVKVEGVPGSKMIHEFDFIVEFKDRFYIFETKTGSLGVERWIEHARMFNDNPGPNRFLMCSAANDLPGKFFQPYRLFHLDSLAEEFAAYVKHEFGME